jgi:very-short-patch-repair endonuclease
MSGRNPSLKNFLMTFDYDYYCCRCNHAIRHGVFDYSIDKFQIPLCEACQDWYRGLKTKPSKQSKKLFLALRERGLKVELEYFDGYKRIDIFSKESLTHIEIDGEQHYTDPLQALSDLLRTMYSTRDGYYTLRIPNSLIDKYLKDAANIISRILNENKSRKRPPEQAHYQRMMRHFVRHNRNSLRY